MTEKRSCSVLEAFRIVVSCTTCRSLCCFSFMYIFNHEAKYLQR